MHTVQVLLSAYNGEKYIEEQIESILKQEEVEERMLLLMASHSKISR